MLDSFWLRLKQRFFCRMNAPVAVQGNSILDGVRFENHPAFLCAYLAGDHCDVERYLACFRAIAKECRARHKQRVLVVDDLQPDLSFLQVCAWINRMFSFGVQGLTISIARGHCHRPELYQFGETLALNQGLNLRIFFNTAAAERWLLATTDSPRPKDKKSASTQRGSRPMLSVLSTHLD